MPIIRVEMLRGRTVEQKREIVEVLTRELARIARCRADGVHVVIDEVAEENWGVGGRLCSDKHSD